MHDNAVQAADRLELDVLGKLERMYPAAISPLMEKHKGTFAKLEKLEKDGAIGRARVLIRRSGLVDDVAKALAAVGVKAADLADLAEQEPPFTKLSLDNLGNEEIIRRQLQVEIEKHFRAKEGVQGLADRIRDVADTTMNRAKTIAQTERTRALNGMRVSQAIRDYLDKYDKAVKGHRKRPELPLFQWINPKTAKEPRHMHVAISGDVRPVGEEFLPSLRYPGDPNAPASQTVNCHCYIRRYTR